MATVFHMFPNILAGSGRRSRLPSWTGSLVCFGSSEHVYKCHGQPCLEFLLTLSLISPQIKHLQSTLVLRFRTRLTRYIHDLYLSRYPDLRYYRLGLGTGPPASDQENSKVENPSGQSNHIEGIDQYITADVESWAEGISGL